MVDAHDTIRYMLLPVGYVAVRPGQVVTRRYEITTLFCRGHYTVTPYYYSMALLSQSHSIVGEPLSMVYVRCRCRLFHRYYSAILGRAITHYTLRITRQADYDYHEGCLAHTSTLSLVYH